FETKQIFYTSKDGTKVPMFITHKKGIELTGDHPVFLFEDGGYKHTFYAFLLPTTKNQRVDGGLCQVSNPRLGRRGGRRLWLEAGGIYAMPNLRGGGEFGEKWHLDGILDKKQNVFDDFIAAAEWLIDHNYTTPSRLAIMGGSNGGLLVGASITQRPELFGAA